MLVSEEPPSLEKYYDDEFNKAYNRTYIPLLEQRINTFVFNFLVYEGTMKTDDLCASAAKFGVSFGAKQIIDALVGSVVEASSHLVEVHTSVPKEYVEIVIKGVAVDSFKGVLSTARDFFAQGISTTFSTVVELTGTEAVLKKSRVPFGEFYASRVEKFAPEKFHALQEQATAGLRVATENYHYPAFPINPFDVGLFTALSNAICAIVYPIFGYFAAVNGRKSAQLKSRTASDGELFNEVLTNFLLERKRPVVTTHEIALRLELNQLSYQRYHSDLTEVIITAHDTAQSAKQTVTSTAAVVTDAVSNVASKMTNAFNYLFINA